MQGVMNIMTGGDELGQMMVEHPKIAQISFTGSAATGKKIMATGAATLKKVRARPFPVPSARYLPASALALPSAQRSSRLWLEPWWLEPWQYQL